jgi:hypothetical protein
MKEHPKLILIKFLHTAVWLFFNAVIFYMLYAVLTNKLDTRLWICYGLIVSEGLTLLVFRWYCPLTVWARKYSDSTKHNFDIYLPEWLARHNKTIYTSIVGIIFIMTLVRLSQ